MIKAEKILDGSAPQVAVPALTEMRAPPLPPVAAADVQIADVMELSVTLSMEVGRKQITIRELLQLAPGAVVELDRGTDEAFDVLANGSVLARGEAVVVNSRCGVRFTEVVRRPPTF